VKHQTHLDADDVSIRYELPPTKSAKMLLLTTGCVLVPGHWYGDLGEFFLGWAPMPRRNKQREEEILAQRRSTR
jgi:hypothetical protein